MAAPLGPLSSVRIDWEDRIVFIFYAAGRGSRGKLFEKEGIIGGSAGTKAYVAPSFPS